MQEADFLTIKEVAVLAGISSYSIRRYVASGRLDAVKKRRTILIPRSAVEKLVRQCAKCLTLFVPKASPQEPLFCPVCAPLARFRS